MHAVLTYLSGINDQDACTNQPRIAEGGTI